MNGEVLYMMTSLPAVGSIDQPPPVTLKDMRERAAESSAASELVDAVLTGDDLLQREAFLVGEMEEVEPAVLTAAQVREQEPLPEFLIIDSQERDASTRLPSDRIWEAYFRHAAGIAEQRRCPLLTEWVSFEVGLRNALVRARAKALGLDAATYLVAEDLASRTDEFEAVVNEWSAASEPLAGMKVLDRARWEWLLLHDQWYSFDVDELVAYAAKLMLVHRWDRIRTVETTVQSTA